MYRVFGEAEFVETVIIGGGQAGLAVSYTLKQAGREHVVLEQAPRPGNSWRSSRWDSFTLVTPNWTLKMPGAEYDGPDREGFMPRDQIVAYFESYPERFHLPVQYNTCVSSVEPLEPLGYLVRINGRPVATRNVVIATGQERGLKIPSFAASLSPRITQLHSRDYRNPQSLPEGAVLVVGSAQSGCQIAEELQEDGRRVYLSTGGAGRAPRRYRGKDTFEWLFLSGMFDAPPERLPFPKEQFRPPQLSGACGGHSLNLHKFAREGMRLFGHTLTAEGETVWFAPDMHQNLAKADMSEKNMLAKLDAFIQASGIDAPVEELPQLRDGFDQPVMEKLDLQAEGINTIVWATGFTNDFSFIKLPVTDSKGYPIQVGGVSSHPGLYFVGMPWMPTLKTGMLSGVGESAARVVSAMMETA